MKTLLLTLAILAISAQAIAADVIVHVTVPDAYVPRITAMIQDKYMHGGCNDCLGLNVKQCFAKMSIRKVVQRELFLWELRQARKDARVNADASVSEIEITSE